MNQDDQQADTTEAAYQRYFDALLAGDRAQCQRLVEGWLEADPDLARLYEGLFRRSLYEVGVQWENGRVSVATEHLATAITERMLALVYPRLFARPHTGKSALVSCAANEFHQVGAKMVADMFEMHGWRCWFLGANTPVPNLLALIRDKKPDVVTLSLTLYFNQDALLAMAEAVRGAFADLPILIGGQGFQNGGMERFERIAGVKYLSTLAQLESWMEAQTSRAH